MPKKIDYRVADLIKNMELPLNREGDAAHGFILSTAKKTLELKQANNLPQGSKECKLYENIIDKLEKITSTDYRSAADMTRGKVGLLITAANYLQTLYTHDANDYNKQAKLRELEGAKTSYEYYRPTLSRAKSLINNILNLPESKDLFQANVDAKNAIEAQHKRRL